MRFKIWKATLCAGLVCLVIKHEFSDLSIALDQQSMERTRFVKQHESIIYKPLNECIYRTINLHFLF
jgi:hypothetical protein